MTEHRTTRPESEHATRRHVFAATLATAATYVYFLLFVRLAFIGNPKLGASQELLDSALALGGIFGSLLAVRSFSVKNAVRHLAAGFGGCAAFALLSLTLQAAAPALLCGLAIGIGIGWTSTTLVLCLRPSVHLPRLGSTLGLGVGCATAFCEQPLVFSASGTAQTVMAASFAVLGAAASLKLGGEPQKVSSSYDYRRMGVALWISIFLVLVWLDSASTAVVQQSPFLKPETWDGILALQGNSFVALCAALLTGLALNGQQLPSAAGFSLIAFLASSLFLDHSGYYFPAAQVFHTAAASSCAVAFLYYPARSGRPWVSALFLAAAGWFGLVGGQSMARTLHGIPSDFALVVTALGIGALVARYYWIQYTRAAEENSSSVS